MPATAAQLDNIWSASLALAFRRASQRTILAKRHRRGPLAVQRALYPEDDLPHVYILHPPGGVAGGDQLDVQVDVAERASALLTTPGATKFYRTIGPQATLHQNLNVKEGSLEWLPQENIVFPGADIEVATQVTLTGNARYIGWEITCLGRPTNDETFDRGRAVFMFRVIRDGRPVLLERLIVEGQHMLSGVAGLRGKPVTGMLCATVDDNFSIDALRKEINCPVEHKLGLTVVDGLLVARYLGDSTEVAMQLFVALWKSLRPVTLGRIPCAPRIWRT